MNKADPNPQSHGNADPQDEVDPLFKGAAFAEQQRLKLNRADEDASHCGRDAQLDQQINEDEALFHCWLNDAR